MLTTAPQSTAETSGNTIPAPAKQSARPSVFAFLDYRRFLSSWLAWKKAGQATFSGAVFARLAGLGSHTLLGMVIRGKRNLSYESARAFSRALALDPREAMYFEQLVFYNQARSAADQAELFSKLVALAGRSESAIARQIRDQAEVLASWHVLAVWQLVRLPEFREDADWISKKLKKRVSPAEARQAIRVLLGAGLLQRDSQGALVLEERAFDLDPGVRSFAIRGFHRSFLARADQAIDEPMEERELSSFTVAVTREELRQIRERVKEFRLALNRDFPARADRNPEVVIAANMQVLVLTESDPETQKER